MDHSRGPDPGQQRQQLGRSVAADQDLGGRVDGREMVDHCRSGGGDRLRVPEGRGGHVRRGNVNKWLRAFAVNRRHPPRAGRCGRGQIVENEIAGAHPREPCVEGQGQPLGRRQADAQAGERARTDRSNDGVDPP